MLKSILMAALVGIALTQAACTETALDPAYPTSSLAWDEGLIGEWQDEDGDDGRYVVTSRKMAIEGDRLDPNRDVDGGFLQDKPREDELLDVYTVTVHTNDDDIRGPIELNAYVFEAGGSRFLSMQPTLSQLVQAGLALPIHMVLKLERDGDRITITPPAVPIFWMPNLRSLDAPRVVDPNPIDLDELLALSAESKQIDNLGFAYTSSIDRLLEFFERYAGDERLWEGGEPKVFQRVVDPGEPKVGD